MNFRLRIHLPLIVPTMTATTMTNGDDDSDNDNTDPKEAHHHRPPCGIQVGPLVREWIPGQALVLDDSYRHAVWNDTDSKRVILLVDIWHPDVTPRERHEIVDMFAQAAQQQARNAVWQG